MLLARYVRKDFVDRIRTVDLLDLNAGRNQKGERKAITIWLNQLEWLILRHIGMITEHFCERLEEYFFQPLKMTRIKKDCRRR